MVRFQKMGKRMLRYRLVLVTAGILFLTAPSAWAFSQSTAGASEGGNSSFTDPDDQMMSNFGTHSSAQPMQLGVKQQGAFDPIWWEQSLHGYGPYYQTLPRRK